ncbi:hypothetical protein N7E81_06715 [Reichenbachiella carrageenanivorans]|uniref:YhhN-like protein n=1 Tax=Reichenbachiella carrageenanivorans TaxID=2979869 RepID=A0ABY6D595_9BACT|nr:hypothetical protein [Reichenbachiella carrageenanivorans]UXX80790.1 hypothetical protein N7E81_06715 [Reichenbachiella carrageenanivorans]
MQVPTIELLGLQVTEPMTWITNWMVAVSCFVFGHRLFHDEQADLSQKFWALFFLFMGMASMTGGVAHGFIHYVGHKFHHGAWLLSGIAVFCAQLAVLPLIEKDKVRSAVRIFCYVQLMAMSASVLIFQHFSCVLVDSVVGLIGVVIPVSLVHFAKNKDRRSLWVVIGVLTNLLPAMIHLLKFSINEWFNFNDISHVVMIGCFYVMYRAAATRAVATVAA